MFAQPSATIICETALATHSSFCAVECNNSFAQSVGCDNARPTHSSAHDRCQRGTVRTHEVYLPDHLGEDTTVIIERAYANATETEIRAFESRVMCIQRSMAVRNFPHHEMLPSSSCTRKRRLSTQPVSDSSDAVVRCRVRQKHCLCNQSLCALTVFDTWQMRSNYSGATPAASRNAASIPPYQL